MASVLISQKFSKDQVIVNEGDQASSFYIIAEGKVGAVKDGKLVRVMVAGESFGEQALLGDGSVRALTVKAVEGEAKVLALGRDTIQQLLGDQVQSIIYKNSCKWALQKSQLFGKLPVGVIEKLLETVQFKSLKKGQPVFQKNEKVGMLAIVAEGSAVNETLKVKVASKGEVVKEDSLKDVNRGSQHMDVISMEVDGIVGFINYNKFRDEQGSLEKLQGFSDKKADQQDQGIAGELNKKQIKDLVYINKLGSGQFGSVYLVKLKGNNELFALKYVTRAHVQQFGI